MDKTLKIFIYSFLSLFPIIQFDIMADDKQNTGTFESVSFQTRFQMPVYQIEPKYEEIFKLLARNLGTASEGILLNSAIGIGQQNFQLTPEEANSIMQGFSKVYVQITADPIFKNIPSALSDCFSKNPSRNGHYFIYSPTEINDKTQLITFLHGFGGNLLFYSWILKEQFPNSIIIAPSYGLSWQDGPSGYLQEIYKDVSNRSKVKLTKSWLFAVSAGGPAGFRIYNENPALFKGYVCLASSPLPSQMKGLDKNLKVLMLNGIKDNRFPIAGVRESAAALSKQLPNFKAMEIDSDHFFLLTKRDDTFKIIQDFMTQADYPTKNKP